MPTDWDSEEQEQMAEGYHRIECVKVMTEDKDGNRRLTSKGDPMLLAVWENAEGLDCLTTFTLTPKAMFRLKECLKRCGANTAQMTADGVELRQFEDYEFAAKYLIGLKGWAYVTPRGKYLNVDFVNESDVPIEKLKESQSPAGGDLGLGGGSGDEDIPF